LFGSFAVLLHRFGEVLSFGILGFWGFFFASAVSLRVVDLERGRTKQGGDVSILFRPQQTKQGGDVSGVCTVSFPNSWVFGVSFEPQQTKQGGDVPGFPTVRGPISS
jgi:hypothetical protein